jgi:ssDNA-binding replication factor A large subunit
MIKISEIKNLQYAIYVKGKICEKSPVGNVTGKDGNLQKKAIAKLCDGSGQIQITLWKDDAERITDGDNVELNNGYSSIIQNILNITAGFYGKIIVLDEDIICDKHAQDDSNFKKIDQIQENDKGISVMGTIEEKTSVASITGRDGKLQKQAFCKLVDDTGKFTMTLWKDDAEKFQDGDNVYLRNAYVVNTAHGLNLTVGYYGTITKKDNDEPHGLSFDKIKESEL